MSAYIISYDLGTGGIKTSLINAEGQIVDSLFAAYPTYYPCPGQAEQAPEDWWNAIVETTRKLLARAGNEVAAQVKCLGISGHSLGVVPIGKNGELLRRTTPIWNDQRATEQADRYFADIDTGQWYDTTGNGFPPACYPVFKIMWYKEHKAEMFARTDKIIGTKDYCNYRFTGVLCTDPSYASGSGVYDLATASYDDTLIEASGLPRHIFPDIRPSDSVIGTIRPEVTAQTGLPTGVKVVAGGVDNSCMALGAKGTRDGRSYTSLGSSAWVALVSKRPILNSRRQTYVFAHVLPGLYASATCIFSAGTSLQWVRNTCCPDLLEKENTTGENAYDAIGRLAASAAPGAKGLLFNPSLAGGSMMEPVPYMGGAFAGLRLHHTRADLLRATLEGIALNLRMALDTLRTQTCMSGPMLFVGGGAKSAFWMQLFADIYGLPVLKTRIDQEAATLGAAALALNGIGLWNSYDNIDSLHTDEKVFLPQPDTTAFYEQTVLTQFTKLTGLIAELETFKQRYV